MTTNNRTGYAPGRVIPNATAIPPVAGTPVRGVAMSVREFIDDPALAPKLAASFTKDTLKTMHEDKASGGCGLYGEPCVNCRSLLPCFDVPVGAVDYDLDAKDWGIQWKTG